MKKYGYTEIRKIFSDDFRTLCINNRWYTEGNNREYADIMHHIDSIENITTDDLVEIAQNVCDHSDDNCIDSFTYVMFELARICHSFFEED